MHWYISMTKYQKYPMDRVSLSQMRNSSYQRGAQRTAGRRRCALDVKIWPRLPSYTIAAVADLRVLCNSIQCFMLSHWIPVGSCFTKPHIQPFGKKMHQFSGSCLERPLLSWESTVRCGQWVQQKRTVLGKTQKELLQSLLQCLSYKLFGRPQKSVFLNFQFNFILDTYSNLQSLGNV